MPNTCAVIGCEASERNSDDVILHRFPKEEHVRRRWMILCMRKNVNPAVARICSLHFRKTDYERNLKYELLGLPVPKSQIKLKKGTLPTQRLPASAALCVTGHWVSGQCERPRVYSRLTSAGFTMPHVCAVLGCDSKERKQFSASLHSFPKNEEQRQKWIECCKRKNINPNNARICSLHFRQSDFEINLMYQELKLPVPTNQRKLQEGALPSLRLPGSEDCAEHGPQGVLRRETKAAATQTSVCVSRPHVSDCDELCPQGVLRTEAETGLSFRVCSAMPNSCIALGCHERADKKSDPSVTFHQLPKDPCRRQKWLVAIQRNNLTPGKYARLCSKHFAPEDFDRTSLCYVRLRYGAVPSIFEAVPAHLQKKINNRKPPTSHPVCGAAPQEAAVSTPAVPENHFEINSSDLLTKCLVKRKLEETEKQLHVCHPEGTNKMANSSISVVKRPKAVKSERSDSEEDQPEFVKEKDVEIKEEVKDDYLDSSNLEGQSFMVFPNDEDSMKIKEEDLDEVDIKEEEVEDWKDEGSASENEMKETKQ